MENKKWYDLMLNCNSDPRRFRRWVRGALADTRREGKPIAKAAYRNIFSVTRKMLAGK